MKSKTLPRSNALVKRARKRLYLVGGRLKPAEGETPKHYSWRREVFGICDFIARVNDSAEIRGQAWVDSMKDYYEKRLDKLLDAEPA